MPRDAPGSQCEPTRFSKRKGTRTLFENRDAGSVFATKVAAAVPASLRLGPTTHDRDGGTRPRERGRPARNGPQAHGCPGSAGVPPAMGRRPTVVLGARASRPQWAADPRLSWERGRPARNGPQTHGYPGSAGVPPAMGRRPTVILGARASRPQWAAGQRLSMRANDDFVVCRRVDRHPRSREYLVRDSARRSRRQRLDAPGQAGSGRPKKRRAVSEVDRARVSGSHPTAAATARRMWGRCMGSLRRVFGFGARSRGRR